jgi:glycosyltransferase involved in cell wall biosynthesis
MLTRDPNMLLALVRDASPALIHAHFGVEGVYGVPLAAKLGLPLVTTFHGFDASLTRFQLLRSGKVSWISYALNRGALARSGSLFICVSEFIRQRVLALGFPEERTRVHYIGVDANAFLPGEEDPARPVVLHTARLVEKKGTQYLLAAFSAICDRHREAKLVIIGDGPLRNQLMKLSSELGLVDRVTWLGSRNHAEVKQWLRQASVFCLPSCTASNGDTEGLSIVLLEAAAAGIPVVSTYHAGIPEAVIHAQTGYLVRERNIKSLSEALDALLSSYELRRRLGVQARALVQKDFDVTTQTRKLEQMYADLIH